MTEPGTRRLSECRPGEGGCVASVRGDGPVVQRLLEMGLVEGVEVTVVRTAPLGDPIEVDLGDYLLSLRKAEADAVKVRP